VTESSSSHNGTKRYAPAPAALKNKIKRVI
jgi:hypothetical protein